MTRKSTSSSSSRLWKELWNDRHFRLVPRNSNGTFSGAIHFVSKKLEKPEIVFGKGHYKYFVKTWIEGESKPRFVTVKSPDKLYAPAGSRNRKAIYARIREIVEKSDKKVRRMRLITTFDLGTGERVEW